MSISHHRIAKVPTAGCRLEALGNEVALYPPTVNTAVVLGADLIDSSKTFPHSSKSSNHPIVMLCENCLPVALNKP